MPRIAGVPTADATWLTRIAYWFARRRFGAVPEPVTIVAHHPKLMMASARHELAVEKATTVLPTGLGDLVVYRTAVRLGCSWCIDFGTMLQKHQGLDIERLKEIHDYATSPSYTELERLALAYADAMTDTPTSVTDEQFAELDRRLGHRGVLELTYLIALENMRARMNHALGITDQGFTSGDACRVPVPPDAEVRTGRA
ncbi:carboxymuconolactone decarboxylase family protein [Solihabitans fulvus]|uniref:Carboxymuconolactone decarboxylase family protein n=1 Tax=Solihabitans fulvus TaxID=1892852 RepID=A0A5B2XSG4_9PSEU|nr:carboxymuconolactone decarboxylase family protein [Solihabitans fulvus]KAA2266045.1 carboxymuconolactone decarboxylase family protein [Solihabitans fulvus]